MYIITISWLLGQTSAKSDSVQVIPLYTFNINDSYLTKDLRIFIFFFFDYLHPQFHQKLNNFSMMNLESEFQMHSSGIVFREDLLYAHKMHNNFPKAMCITYYLICLTWNMFA